LTATTGEATRQNRLPSTHGSGSRAKRNGQSSITVTVDGVLIENAEWPRDRRFPVVDDEADAEALLMLMAGYLVDHGVASPC